MLKSLEKITLPMFPFLFLPLSTFLTRGYGGTGGGFRCEEKMTESYCEGLAVESAGHTD